MKRIVSFLLTLSLLLSIAPLTFATETTELTEVTSVPVALTYDSDLLVKEGDTLNSNTFMGGETIRNFIKGTYPFAPALSGTTYEVIKDGETVTRPGIATSANKNFGAFAASGIEATVNSLPDVVAHGVTFNIPAEGENGGVNDSIIRYGTQDAITVKASGRPTDRIYFVQRANGKTYVDITFKYTDGTTSAGKQLTSQLYENFKQNSYINYVAKTYSISTSESYTISEEGTAEKILKYKTEKLPLASDTSTTKSVAIPDGNGDYVTVPWESTINWVGVSYIEVDSGKIVEDIIIKSPTGSTVLLAIFAASERLLSNDALQAATVFEGEIADVSNEQLTYAKACADELVNYRGASADDYKEIYDEYNDRQYGLTGDNPEFNCIDISSYFDADMFAKPDDTAGSNWKGGLTNGSNKRYEAINGNSLPADGLLNVTTYKDYTDCAIIYDENGTATHYQNADGTTIEITTSNAPTPATVSNVSIPFQLKPETFAGNVNDTIDLDTPKTIKLSGRPLKQVWFAFSSAVNAYSNITLTVQYTDGTFGTLKVAPAESYTIQYIDAKIGNVSKWIVNDYLAYQNYTRSTGQLVHKNDSGIVEAWATDDKSEATRSGFTFIGKEVAENKGIEYITFSANTQTLLAAVTEIPVDTEVLTAYVDSVVEEYAAVDEIVPSVLTPQQSAQIRLADDYAEELLKRHVYRDTDTQYVTVKNLLEQAEYNEKVYVNIPASDLTADVFVPNKSSILKADYNGRNDAEAGNDKVYPASSVAANGIINMDPPTGAAIPDVTTTPGSNGKTYEDVTFKLSGQYNDFGNDAVLVDSENTEGVTVNFSEAEQRKYKDIYFLLDSPRGEDVNPYILEVKINFTDGTSIGANTRLYYNQAAYSNYIYAHKGFASTPIIFNEGTNEQGQEILTTSLLESDNKLNLYASGLNPIEKATDEEGNSVFTYPELLYKDVESVTFMPNDRGVNYTVLAITAVPYSTEELLNFWGDALNEWYVESNMTVELGVNDDLLYKGALAGKELYESRKAYDIIDETSYTYDALPILEAVDAARQANDSGFTTELGITVSEGNVKANAYVTNNEIDGKAVVLIIAVYGQNNKLLDIAASPLTSFELGAENELLETPSCDAHDGEAVSYSAFVWESLDSLRPISCITQAAE